MLNSCCLHFFFYFFRFGIWWTWAEFGSADRMTWRSNSPGSSSLFHARHLGMQRRTPSFLSRIFTGVPFIISWDQVNIFVNFSNCVRCNWHVFFSHFRFPDYQWNEWWSLSDVMEAIVFPENIKFAAILYCLIHAHLIFKLLRKKKNC